MKDVIGLVWCVCVCMAEDGSRKSVGPNDFMKRWERELETIVVVQDQQIRGGCHAFC